MFNLMNVIAAKESGKSGSSDRIDKSVVSAAFSSNAPVIIPDLVVKGKLASSMLPPALRKNNYVPVLKQDKNGSIIVRKRILPWKTEEIFPNSCTKEPLYTPLALPSVAELSKLDHESIFNKVKYVLEQHKPLVLDYSWSMKEKLDFLRSKGPASARNIVSSHLMHVRGEAVKDWSSYLSAFRSYLNFCAVINDKPFPISVSKLSGYLALTRMDSTANVHKCALKKVSEVLKVPFPSVPELRSVIAGIRRNQPMRRSKDPVSPSFLNKIIGDSTICDDVRMLFAVAWMFLLRVGDEGIPLLKVKDEKQKDRMVKLNSHSAVFADDDREEVCIRLKSRKNALEGDFIYRSCTCKGKVQKFDEKGKRVVSWPIHACPYHVFWKVFCKDLLPGEEIFDELDYASCLHEVKDAAARYNEKGEFGTHSLRKGGCSTIAFCGGSKGAILAAGRWAGSSDSWRKYVSEDRIECEALIAAAGSENDEDYSEEDE
ncbi:unnamed protein product [Amoebophrya sp. A25]|nr:unnamed protein product [Amoebophrya sp. A25]|eukprot:GSA25T00018567001.1